MRKNNRILIPIIVLWFTLMLIIFSETISDKTITAMKSTVLEIIPALFPYMVISSLIVSSGAAEILGKLLPVSRMFNLPKCASTPIILGALCGFPLGAKSSTELYQNGYISKPEAEALISIANNTGPTFLIFVIGASFWKNIYFGIFLYISQLISSVVASLIVNNLLFPIKKETHNISPVVTILPFITSFSNAVRGAVISSLYVCGYITFFSVVTSIIENLFYFIPEKILLIFSAVIEFSEASSLSSYYPDSFGAFVCGFAIGWSGLSVFCQTAAFTAPLDLSLKKCFLVKFIQGILLGLSAAFFTIVTEVKTQTECFIQIHEFRIIHVAIISFTLLCIYFIYLIKKCKYA